MSCYFPVSPLFTSPSNGKFQICWWRQPPLCSSRYNITERFSELNIMELKEMRNPEPYGFFSNTCSLVIFLCCQCRPISSSPLHHSTDRPNVWESCTYNCSFRKLKSVKVMPCLEFHIPRFYARCPISLPHSSFCFFFCDIPWPLKDVLQLAHLQQDNQVIHFLYSGHVWKTF